MKFNFLAFKKKKAKYLRSGLMQYSFTSLFKHPVLQIILFTDMKVCLYAGDTNINRKKI